MLKGALLTDTQWQQGRKESGWEVLKGILRNVKHYKNFFGQRLSQIGQHPV